MECDICMEKYDHSINKPLVLFRCGHTLCSKCVNNLVEKKCPSCSGIIEETRPNWALLKAAAESEYDKMKSEVLKKFTEIESLERKLETTEQQKTENNSDLIKRLKSHVESRASELIKQINTDKKMLLKEIEAKCKDLNQQQQQATTEPALLQTKEKKIESKAKLNDNKFDKQELMDLKSELISCLSLLNIKAKSIGEYADSFQLAVNENTKRGENLIGEIKKYQMSLLNVETGQASSEASHSNNSTSSSLSAVEFHPKLNNWNADTMIRTAMNEVIIFDVATGQDLKTFEDEFNVRKENPMPNQIQCLQVLDEKNVIVFSDDPIIKQFDLTTGQVVKRFKGHIKTQDVVSKCEMGVCWGEIISQNRLVSCGWDKTIRVWSLETAECIRLLKGHTGGVIRVKELPNEQLISTSEDKTLKLWNIFSGKCSKTFVGHEAGLRCIAILPNNRVVTGSDDRSLRVWDLNRADSLAILKGHAHRITCVEVLPNNQKICSASEDTTLRIWDANKYTCIRKIVAHSMLVWTLKIISNDKAISGGVDSDGFEQTMKVWDLNSGKCMKTIHELNNFIQSF